MTDTTKTGIALPAGFALISEDPEVGPAVSESLEQVEELLRESVASTDPFADRTARHLVEAGGKRIRPLLAVLASHLGDPSRREVVTAAVVVELTHLATLYHDDVMDSAPLRRGAPTAHELWGNSVAILTGDLIFARASRLVSGLGGEALAVQAETFERLCLGQLHETQGPAEGENPREHYLSVLRDKTGSLVAAAGHFGAMLAGAPREHVEIMVAYGEKVGVAFQLADDVIDVTGAKEKAGKRPGTDLREGVPTLPVLLLREKEDESSRRLLGLIDGDLSSDESLAEAVSALAAHPVAEESWGIARQWAEDAIATLEPLPDGTVKEALRSFALAVVDREV